MSETKTLILQGSGYELTVAPEAEALKSELLTHSALIVEVRDPSAIEAARNQVKKLAAVLTAVEKTRNAIKAPVLQVGREIDAKAKEFIAELDTEKQRICRLMEDYAQEVERERQRVLREVEEQRRAEEKARAAAEAARKQAEQEAEAARIAAEKAEWEAGDEAQQAKADEARKQAEATAEAARKQAAEETARLEAERSKIVAMPAKAEGVKFTTDFEVTDLHALYQYSAALVTMEPKRREILELIKQLNLSEDSQVIPGIKITKKAIVSTR